VTKCWQDVTVHDGFVAFGCAFRYLEAQGRQPFMSNEIYWLEPALCDGLTPGEFDDQLLAFPFRMRRLS
jgi:hypothetical protein